MLMTTLALAIGMIVVGLAARCDARAAKRPGSIRGFQPWDAGVATG